MPQVTAYRVDTGQRVTIPSHWLGHPVHGAPFSATPPEPAPSPDYDDQYEPVSDYDQPENPEEGDINAVHSF